MAEGERAGEGGAPSGEIDVFELGHLAWRRRSLLLVWTGLWLAAALVFSWATPNVWEGEGVLEIGQVGQSGQVGQAGFQLVEPVARVVERLSSRGFQDSVLSDLGIPTGDDDPAAKLYRRSAKVRAIPGTDLVQLSVQTHSPESCRKALEITAQRLRVIHDELAAPITRVLREQLARVDGDLDQARSELTRLRSLEEKGAQQRAENLFSSLYLRGLIEGRISDVRNFQDQKLWLEEKLNPSRTHSTSLFGPVHVSSNPVAPRTVRNVVVAVCGALAAGLLLILVHEGLRGERRADEGSSSLIRPRRLDRLG
jgi:capsular polysaccharide biosynthesis protein